MDSPRILIVDDEPDNFDVIETFLTDQEYHLYYACNGQEAIATLDNLNPDLILLDVMMPEMDGIEVCRKIKERATWQYIPIVMVTALSAKEDLALCLEAGADDFIGKPVNSMELKARVHSMLRIKEHYDQINGFSLLQRNTINFLGKNIEELTGNIAISLSHELNTPLNGIMGVISILKDDIDHLPLEDVKEMLTWVEESAQRLADLTSRFHTYLELELCLKGNHSCPISTTVFSPSLTENYLMDIAKKFDRTLDLNCDFEETEINISEEYLLMILTELVTNALKFSPPETPILLKNIVEENSVTISVEDYGRGMTPQQISEIGMMRQFERDIHQQQGIGLGLKLVQTILKTFGGTFNISSIYQQKTKVSITLPKSPVS